MPCFFPAAAAAAPVFSFRILLIADCWSQAVVGACIDQSQLASTPHSQGSNSHGVTRFHRHKVNISRLLRVDTCTPLSTGAHFCARTADSGGTSAMLPSPSCFDDIPPSCSDHGMDVRSLYPEVVHNATVLSPMGWTTHKSVFVTSKKKRASNPCNLAN